MSFDPKENEAQTNELMQKCASVETEINATISALDKLEAGTPEHVAKKDEYNILTASQAKLRGERDRLVELGAVYAAGEHSKARLHNNAPGMPDLAQQQSDMIGQLNAAATTGDMTRYQQLRRELKEHQKKNGDLLREVVVDAGESYSAKKERERKAIASGGTDIESRMTAAAHAGDMTLYNRLKSERRAAQV